MGVELHGWIRFCRVDENDKTAFRRATPNRNCGCWALSKPGLRLSPFLKIEPVFGPDEFPNILVLSAVATAMYPCHCFENT